MMIGVPSVFSRPVPILLFIIIAVLLDQALKFAVDSYLPLQTAVPVMPMLSLYRTYNLGIAFSMLSGVHGWLIVGARILIVAFVFQLWRRTTKERWLAHLGFALMIAGGDGNLVDRFMYGHVIDYILLHVGPWSFAVFNLADVFIAVGTGCIFLGSIPFGRTQALQPAASLSEPA
jgi:signal peptidase II